MTLRLRASIHDRDTWVRTCRLSLTFRLHPTGTQVGPPSILWLKATSLGKTQICNAAREVRHSMIQLYIVVLYIQY